MRPVSAFNFRRRTAAVYPVNQWLECLFGSQEAVAIAQGSLGSKECLMQTSVSGSKSKERGFGIFPWHRAAPKQK
jgi:hypothetical protein